MKNKYEVKGNYTVIFLRQRGGSVIETLIDTEDLKKVMSISGSWCAFKSPHTDTYYVRGYHKGDRILLHRLVMNAPENLLVDHINHNTLDNRKSQLKLVNYFYNNQNRKGLNKSNKSGFRNVSWNKEKKKWAVRINVNGIRKQVGYFNDLELANNAAVEARATLFKKSG